MWIWKWSGIIFFLFLNVSPRLSQVVFPQAPLQRCALSVTTAVIPLSPAANPTSWAAWDQNLPPYLMVHKNPKFPPTFTPIKPHSFRKARRVKHFIYHFFWNAIKTKFFPMVSLAILLGMEVFLSAFASCISKLGLQYIKASDFFLMFLEHFSHHR